MIKSIQLQGDGMLEKAMQYAKEAGYRHISLGFGSSKAFHADDWKDYIKNVQELLNKNDLVCMQTHLPYYHLLISCEQLEESMETAIKRCIEASAMLGAEFCVYHPRSSVDFDYDAERALDVNHRVISEYITCAENAGTRLAIENMPLFPNVKQWNFYCADYRELITLYDSFHNKNLGVCWDFGHGHLACQERELNHVEAIKAVGSRICCTHVHDNSGRDDDHLVPCAGESKISWEQVIPALMRTGYPGALTLELALKDSPVLADYMRHSYACVNYLEKIAKGNNL